MKKEGISLRRHSRAVSVLSKTIPDKIPVAGLTRFTTIDYPGKLAAVIYTQGCSWRCGYCHNAHLRTFDHFYETNWEKTLNFLSRRQGFLEGVVFSGGEPTAHPGLPGAMETVKELGYLIGLHTTGMYPENLREVLPRCDWVGMDIKAPFEEYEKVTGCLGSGNSPRESLRLLIKSGVAYECRTTVHSKLLSNSDIKRIGAQLVEAGVEKYALQKFRPEGCQEPSLCATDEASGLAIRDLQEHFSKIFKSFELRGY